MEALIFSICVILYTQRLYMPNKTFSTHNLYSIIFTICTSVAFYILNIYIYIYITV